MRHIYLHMYKIPNPLPFLLIGSLLMAEVIVIGARPDSALSQHKLSQNDTALIFSILNKNTNPQPEVLSEPSSSFEGIWFDFDFPADPTLVGKDAQLAYSTVYGQASENIATNVYPVAPGDSPPLTAGNPLASVLPPLGSALYFAYQDGGRAWYEELDNVLVLMPNETIRSFIKSSGAESQWMQDKLAYPIVTDPLAYQNYQTNYRAQIIAETTTWVLMKFPSGGLLKVAKPTATPFPYMGGASVNNIIYNLPNILPGYF